MWKGYFGGTRQWLFLIDHDDIHVFVAVVHGEINDLVLDTLLCSFRGFAMSHRTGATCLLVARSTLRSLCRSAFRFC